MSRFSDFYRQLKQRRVIRTAVVYAALVWGALQVADLLAEAAFFSEATVKWLILLALVGFPVTLVLSWFFETPWRERKAISVLGDVLVILAVVVGVLLLAWQQYFRSFARPTVAIVQIESTDTRADTPAFSDHLAIRLRAALATRPELAVTEISSSLHPSLDGKTLAEKAQALFADYVISGTLNQGSGDALRLNLQLFDASGNLLWSEQFEDRLLDISQFESGVLNALWERLPLPQDALIPARATISGCEYPGDPAAIRALVVSDKMTDSNSALTILSELIERFEDNGLLHLARARAYFTLRESAPPPRKPVFNNLGLQELDRFELKCTGHPAAPLLRVHQNPGILFTLDDHESFFGDHPNDSLSLLAYSAALLEAGKTGKASATARAAAKIAPLDPDITCAVDRILSDAGSPVAQPEQGLQCLDSESIK